MSADQLIVDSITDTVWETGEPNKGWQLSDVTLAGTQVGALIVAIPDTIMPHVEVDADDLAECAKFEHDPRVIGLALTLVRKLLAQARAAACQEVLHELEFRSLEEATHIGRSDFERDDMRETLAAPELEYAE